MGPALLCKFPGLSWPVCISVCMTRYDYFIQTCVSSPGSYSRMWWGFWDPPRQTQNLSLYSATHSQDADLFPTRNSIFVFTVHTQYIYPSRLPWLPLQPHPPFSSCRLSSHLLNDALLTYKLFSAHVIHAIQTGPPCVRWSRLAYPPGLRLSLFFPCSYNTVSYLSATSRQCVCPPHLFSPGKI